MDIEAIMPVGSRVSLARDEHLHPAPAGSAALVGLAESDGPESCRGGRRPGGPGDRSVLHGGRRQPVRRATLDPAVAHLLRHLRAAPRGPEHAGRSDRQALAAAVPEAGRGARARGPVPSRRQRRRDLPPRFPISRALRARVPRARRVRRWPRPLDPRRGRTERGRAGSGAGAPGFGLRRGARGPGARAAARGAADAQGRRARDGRSGVLQAPGRFREAQLRRPRRHPEGRVVAGRLDPDAAARQEPLPLPSGRCGERPRRRSWR